MEKFYLSTPIESFESLLMAVIFRLNIPLIEITRVHEN